MAIPNNYDFSLEDVCDELGLTGSNRTLSNCFSSAVPSAFDPAYEGSKNSLRNFRNYDEGGTAPSIIITPSSFTGVSGLGTSLNITLTCNTTWALLSKPSWVSMSATSGTGNAGITLLIAPNNSGSPRSGFIEIRTTTGSPTASDTVFIEQDAGIE